MTAVRTRILRVLGGAALALVGMAGDAIAQQGTGARRAGAPPGQVAAAPPASPIGIEQALYLIRSTLLTLNDANRSGNYTVLRDLAAPDFQAKNTAADLAHIFADLRHRKFDMFAAALIAPQLTTMPSLVDRTGMVRLTGFFPTRPLQINFDLVYQQVDGQWRLFGIAIATPSSPADAALPSAAAAPNATVRTSRAKK